MNYFSLEVAGCKRELPIISISPKIKIASFNLLGDVELVDKCAKLLVAKVKDIPFEIMVGPEVKVVPLVHRMADIMGQKKYVIFRKNIMPYMVNPVTSKVKPSLVLDSIDAKELAGKRVLIVDDVASLGNTTRVIIEMLKEIKAKMIGVATIVKQGVVAELPKQ